MAARGGHGPQMPKCPTLPPALPSNATGGYHCLSEATDPLHPPPLFPLVSPTGNCWSGAREQPGGPIRAVQASQRQQKSSSSLLTDPTRSSSGGAANLDHSPLVVVENTVTSSHGDSTCASTQSSTGCRSVSCSCCCLHPATSTAYSSRQRGNLYLSQ